MCRDRITLLKYEIIITYILNANILNDIIINVKGGETLTAYLKDTLGLKVTQAHWKQEEALPLYLRNGMSYSVLKIEENPCLCVKCDAQNFRISAFQKQKEQLHRYWEGEIALCFETLTSYQRKALIENHISFIVSNYQIYLPWLGMVFQERSAVSHPVETLSRNGQLIVLLMLEKKWNTIRQAELVQMLNVSAMTVSRAVQELEQLGFVKTEKSGRNVTLMPILQGRNLWYQAKAYLQNPVRKRVFAEQCALPSGMLLSGLTALAEKSMLNPPAHSCYAVSSQVFKEMNLQTIDPNWATEEYAEIELWNYDPQLLGENGIVSPLPLALIFEGNEDERIQQAVEEMMENYKW